MPPSAPEREPETSPGQELAVAAESLYLANLLLLPVLSFAALVWLYLGQDRETPPLARAHLAQTLAASVWAGVLLVGVNVVILLVGTWMVVIVYFTVFHSTLVMLGILGLAKAMAGQCWRFPLVGRPLPDGCAGKRRG